MDQVFAPWRIDWVERDDQNPDIEGCVFCALPDHDHREVNLVAYNDEAYVLLNNYPYNPGHVMVVPYTHGGDYTTLDEEVILGHARLKQHTLTALDQAFDPDGYNTGLNLGGGASGGSVNDHIHTHIVPRWQGDTNFMPVISDTKVIVQALEDTYNELHTAFQTVNNATTDDAGAVSLS